MVKEEAKVVNEPVEEKPTTEPIKQDEEDSVEERVVQKLKKVIMYKKELSAKQKAHLEKIHNERKGTKLNIVKKIVEKPTQLDVEAIETVEVKPKPRKKRVIKPKQVQEEPEPIKETKQLFRKSIF